MSFKSYAFCRDSDGSQVLSDPEPLVFSGRQGLIARFVLGTAKRTEQPWRLCPGELHALALPALQLRERLIVFEQAEANTLELLVLEDIHGLSHERTEMMFRFRPLRLLGCVPQLRVGEPAANRVYTEELSLDGGVTAPTASWRWRRTHLALGGVVCGSAGWPDAMTVPRR